jgi:hypothetical protein
VVAWHEFLGIQLNRAMFQKLYKHLEEMNIHLRQQRIDINDAKQEAGKVSGQLETINNTILSQNKPKGGMGPMLQVANLLLCCVAVVVIFFFSYYTLKLSHITRELVKREISASGQVVPSGPTTVSRQISMDKLTGQMQEAMDRHALQQRHLVLLDSLITEQAHSIRELQKLNLVAVRTFSHIKRHLDLADSLAKTASISRNP